MKYVMFTHRKAGVKVPVLFAEALSHADIQAGPDFIATSAGFYSLQLMTCTDQSTSLKMAPEPDDAEICNLVVANLEAMLHMSQDQEANLQKLEKILNERTSDLTTP